MKDRTRLILKKLYRFIEASHHVFKLFFIIVNVFYNGPNNYIRHKSRCEKLTVHWEKERGQVTPEQR